MLNRKEEKKKEKQEKANSEDMKTLVSKDAIQVKLMDPSNFLALVIYIEKLTKNLPEGTNDLKTLSLLKNSIGNE